MHERGELRAGADPDQLAFVLRGAPQGGVLLTQTKREITPLQAALDGARFYVRSVATHPHPAEVPSRR